MAQANALLQTATEPLPVALPWPQLDVGSRLRLFDASLAFLPSTVDAERSKLYVPQNPFVNAPAQFPNTPAARFDDPAVFEEKMSLDSLFFVFWTQPGTYQQFLAARELRRRQWRWHSGYEVWMTRHEDPSVTTPEFEVGSYVYFDHVTWTKRVKSNFTFEYKMMA